MGSSWEGRDGGDRLLKLLVKRGGEMQYSEPGTLSHVISGEIDRNQSYVSKLIKVLELEGMVTVNRGQSGQFIYGIGLTEEGRRKGEQMMSKVVTIIDEKPPAPELPEELDYSQLASEILLQATAAIESSGRLEERIKHLEERCASLTEELQKTQTRIELDSKSKQTVTDMASKLLTERRSR